MKMLKVLGGLLGLTCHKQQPTSSLQKDVIEWTGPSIRITEHGLEKLMNSDSLKRDCRAVKNILENGGENP